MARVTVEDCVDKVTNRFELVLIASHRARGMSAGAELLVERDNDKNPVVALREIADIVGEIGIDACDDGLVIVVAVLAERHLAQEEIAHLVDAILVSEVEGVDDVADRLRHLLALTVDDKGVVHPVTGKPLAERNRLGPLVLVVREPQVLTTAVQVESFAEQIEAHHHTLAMPAGPALAPR